MKRILRITLKTIFSAGLLLGLGFVTVGICYELGGWIMPDDRIIGSLLVALGFGIATVFIYSLGKLLFRFLLWLNDD